jgi:hypothetical protein
VIFCSAIIFGGSAAHAISRLSPMPATVVTSGGRIGSLRLDASDKEAVLASAGQPQVDQTSPGVTSGWEALGYGCGPKATVAPLVAPAGSAGPYCRTVYYLNARTGKIGTFFTSEPSFRDAHGVSVGMRTAKAARLEHAPALSGCLQGIGVSGSRATLHIIISGGHSHRSGNRLSVRGGRVGALVLHSRTNDVGVFDCW